MTISTSALRSVEETRRAWECAAVFAGAFAFFGAWAMLAPAIVFVVFALHTRRRERRVRRRVAREGGRQ
jgi:hypothetical protein